VRGVRHHLAWLAWSALKPGGRSPFEIRALKADSPRRLVLMGLLTNLLNPKAAIFYLSLLPQFIDPTRGSVLLQGLVFGFTQITISMIGNAIFAASAGRIARFLQHRPRWLLIQRWIMGSVLGALAARMAIEARR
jgi:threonine/homoserine/homoserine lactone efflux protein